MRVVLEFAASENFATGEARSVEIARSGTFSAKVGGTVTLTPRDLAEIADTFDPSTDVLAKIGHVDVATDTPHFGSVVGLAYDAVRDRLMAKVVPTPALVRKCREEGFRRVSMELGRKAGRWVLTALAFLGAHKPAIDGLEAVMFSSGEEERLPLDYDTVEGRDLLAELVERRIRTAEKRGETLSFAAAAEAVVKANFASRRI